MTLCLNKLCIEAKNCKRFILGMKAKEEGKEAIWLITPKGNKKIQCELWIDKDMP